MDQFFCFCHQCKSWNLRREWCACCHRSSSTLVTRTTTIIMVIIIKTAATITMYRQAKTTSRERERRENVLSDRVMTSDVECQQWFVDDKSSDKTECTSLDVDDQFCWSIGIKRIFPRKNIQHSRWTVTIFLLLFFLPGRRRWWWSWSRGRGL